MDEGYGRFGSYSRVEMERSFHLDDEDRRLVAMRRRDYNQLGFAVQMVTVRHLGMFPPDPLDVPLELVEYLAEQLGIDDPSCVKSYVDRRMTRFEQADEVEQGIRPDRVRRCGGGAGCVDRRPGVDEESGTKRGRRAPRPALLTG